MELLFTPAFFPGHYPHAPFMLFAIASTLVLFSLLASPFSFGLRLEETSTRLIFSTIYPNHQL